MPEQSTLAFPRDIRYLYDGSLPGFYSCVFHSVYAHELPLEIAPDGDAEPSLLPEKYIATDPARALRVRASIPAKISRRALELVETVYFSCLQGKELAMLRFLLLAYRVGPKVTDMLGDADVHRMLGAERHLLGEAHLLRGFVRFADYGGMLGATISPKNFVLPFIAGHFAARLSEEAFLIYDKTHGAALTYRGGAYEITAVEKLEFAAPGETELRYQAMWKRFYDTIAIEERTNPKCRMTHCPKRYWENMLEVKDLA
jgi:probable DNA metabolism protein